MKEVMRSNSELKSRFPKCPPNKPEIYISKSKTRYPCFGISDIYYELFIEKKTEEWERKRDPLIRLDVIASNPKDRLAFILPEDILHRIESTLQNGKPYIKENDYKEFFPVSTNNNKIARLLFEIFSSDKRDSEKEFIYQTQDHFIQILRAAEFLQQELKGYLCSICDKFIVPKSVSAEANAAFHRLVDTNEHDAISRAVANVFISSMLGLYSMKYSSDETERGFLFSKTYLLNKLGMDFIWLPESISESYIKLQDAQYVYSNGEYQEAYKRICKWLDANADNAKAEELAVAYHIHGSCMYQHPELCVATNSSSYKHESFGERRSKGIEYLERSIQISPEAPEVHYILFEYYTHSNSARALEHLKTAFALGHAKAVIEVAFQFLKTKNGIKEISRAQILEKLTSIIENELQYSDKEVSDCLYLRGLLSKLERDVAEAQTDFAQAAEKGHEKARQELSLGKRSEWQHVPVFSDNQKAPCCFANSLTGNNLAFVSTLPDDRWALFTTGKVDKNYINVRTVNSIDEFIRDQHLADSSLQHSQIVFLFMCEDEDRNLNECLILLDKLFNIALGLSEHRRHEFIDFIDIYVLAKYSMASMLIDANINDMGSEMYFKVHIADETRDAAHQLLCDAPLFIPFLDRTNRADSSNIVLFGCSETNYQLIKESIACAFLGNTSPVTITMLGETAENMERRLRQECPGLYSTPHIDCIRPHFVPCCIEEEDFPSIIYGSRHEKPQDEPLVGVLTRGNYFVVDLLNDCKSIKFAMELRTWLLRSKGTFDRVPFIAVKCMSAQNSYLATHLALSGQASGSSYFSRYDLFPFGVSREMYSYHRLIENPRLEEVALQIHKSYNGGDDRQAENDYYSFSYNSDSSKLTAIGLSYRLFAGGAFFHKKEQYLDYGVFDSLSLLSIYFEGIKTKEERAAALEQSRWNGFMLSRGWEPADVIQVRAYKDQSTGSSHKHTLAKLHPFIREWAGLGSKDLLEILGILKAKYDYDKLPQSTTRKSIKDTPKFLLKPCKDVERNIK